MPDDETNATDKPGTAAEEAGIVDQQAAALEELEEDEPAED
jgi:hypothetical protein